MRKTSIYCYLGDIIENKYKPQFNNVTWTKADSPFKPVTEISFINNELNRLNLLDLK